MEIKVKSESSDQQNQPLIEDEETASTDEDRKTLIQRAINQTFKSTAHLANLLPTGTVLAFQLLAPIFSNQGRCDAAGRAMTACLVSLCAASCFLLSFTDSFKDEDGTVRYGVATLRGLWVIDGTDSCNNNKNSSLQDAAKYKLTFMDFVHACLSVLVFGAVALFDGSVVGCFYPAPSKETEEVLTTLPVGIGVICSMLFVAFPSKRHGIGFPVSSELY